MENQEKHNRDEVSKRDSEVGNESTRRPGNPQSGSDKLRDDKDISRDDVKGNSGSMNNPPAGQ